MRAAIAGLTMVLVALALAACGSDGDDKAGSASGGDAASAKVTPAALVSDTFAAKQTVSSGKLDVGLKLVANGFQGVNGPISVRLRGSFAEGKEGALPNLDLDLSVEAGAIKIAAGLTSVDDGVWIDYAGTPYVLPAATVKQYKDLYAQAEKRGGGGQPLSSLGIDPRSWIENTRIVGDETVGGEAATHVSGDIDVAGLLADLDTALGKTGSLAKDVTLPQGLSSGSASTALNAQTRKDIERSITSAKLDLWTGKDDHILRRLRVAIAFDVPDSVRATAGGLTTGSLAFDVTVTDLNQDQSITAPPNARPFSELQPLLSSVLGA